VTDNPLRDYEAPRFSRKQTPYPTEEQVREILRSFKRRFDPAKCDSARRVPRSRRRFALARNYALVTGLICTAARISEMCALKLVDYHPKELYIVFRNTKTDEDREVPITEDWVKIVDEFLKVRPRGCDADTLFVNEYGTVVKPTAFTMLWKDHLRWAGLPHFTLHSLRHFAATLLAERDLLAAKEILGHRRVETTMIYAHARRQHVRKVHQDTAALAAVLDEEPEEKPIERPILVNKRTERQKRRKLV
jgi:integrase